jgi:hypothetical protein
VSNTADIALGCCSYQIAEGCQTGGGRWVSIRNPDGTVSLIDPATGAAVLPADALAFCPPGESLTHLATVGPNSVFVIPNAGDLESWSVRARVLGVSLEVSSGGANALDPNEVVEDHAQDDDTLTDSVSITTDATGSARVLWLQRLP